jgi:hypothetical protein
MWKGIESLCMQAPGILKCSQMCPRLPKPYPDGGGALAGGEVRPGQANKQARSAIGLTLDRLVVEVRPGRSPARVAAEQKRRGHGGSDGGEDRGGAQQCVAQVASMCPRGGARWVPGHRESAEGRARQW